MYLLSYGESVEVARFQQSAAREKSSFVNLIQKKAHLVLPVDEVRYYASFELPAWKMSHLCWMVYNFASPDVRVISCLLGMRAT